MDKLDLADVLIIRGLGLGSGAIAPALMDEEAGGLDGGMGVTFFDDLDEAGVDGLPVVWRDSSIHLFMALSELGIRCASGIRTRTSTGHGTS